MIGKRKMFLIESTQEGFRENDNINIRNRIKNTLAIELDTTDIPVSNLEIS
jgi:hypothetical protein